MTNFTTTLLYLKVCTYFYVVDDDIIIKWIINPSSSIFYLLSHFSLIIILNEGRRADNLHYDVRDVLKKQKQRRYSGTT